MPSSPRLYPSLDTTDSVDDNVPRILKRCENEAEERKAQFKVALSMRVPISSARRTFAIAITVHTYLPTYHERERREH